MHAKNVYTLTHIYDYKYIYLYIYVSKKVLASRCRTTISCILICIYVRKYVYMCMHVCKYTYVDIDTYVYLFIYICIPKKSGELMQNYLSPILICIYVRKYVYMCMHVCKYTLSMYTFVYMYANTHT